MSVSLSIYDEFETVWKNIVFSAIHLDFLSYNWIVVVVVVSGLKVWRFAYQAWRFDDPMWSWYLACKCRIPHCAMVIVDGFNDYVIDQ